jgi:ATP-dependent DNA helicase RecG
VPPVIRNNEPTHWFTIEFHEKALEREEAATGSAETTQKSTRKQREMTGKTSGKILLLLKDNPASSIPELAEKLGKSERTIERAVQELRLSGLLKRIGPAKGGYWEVVGMGEG